jgi:hypothetical protein
MREGPEALHALKLALARLRERRRRLTRRGLVAIRTGGSSRVSLLRNDALMLAVLDHVAWLIPETLRFRKRVDERLCFDGQEAFLQAFVEEAVAGPADDDLGNFVQRFGGKMGHELMF